MSSDGSGPSRNGMFLAHGNLFCSKFVYRGIAAVLLWYGKGFISRAREKFSPQLVCDIELVGPSHYVPCLTKTLDALERWAPDSFALVKTEIEVIYADELCPPIGFLSRCAFIDSEIENLYDVVWPEYAGYLVRTAKLSQLYRAGHLSVLTRWSRRRDLAYQIEDEVIAALRMNVSVYERMGEKEA